MQAVRSASDFPNLQDLENLWQHARDCYEQGLAINLPPSHYYCAFYLGLLTLTQTTRSDGPAPVLSETKGGNADPDAPRPTATAYFQQALDLLTDQDGYEPAYLRALAQWCVAHTEPDPTGLQDPSGLLQAAYDMCHAPGVVQTQLEIVELIEAAGLPVAPLRDILLQSNA